MPVRSEFNCWLEEGSSARREDARWSWHVERMPQNPVWVASWIHSELRSSKHNTVGYSSWLFFWQSEHPPQGTEPGL